MKCGMTRIAAVAFLVVLVCHGHSAAAKAEPSFRIVVTNSMVGIPLDFQPSAVTSAPPATVRLSLARRGSDSFQVVVLPSVDLTGVRVEPSNLVSSRGKIAATNVEWFVVGHTPSPTKRFPDMLLPARSFDAGKTNAWAIYVTVHAPEKTPAGKYKGTVRVLADGQPPISVPLKATVHDFTLPIGPGNCRTTFSLQDFKKWGDGQYQQYGDYMLRHRVNPDNIYRLQPPRVADLEHFYAQGMNYFTVCKTAKGWDLAPSRAFFAELEKSPNGAALRKMAMFYGYDEKPKETWPAMGECFRVLHETFPDVKTMTTAHVYMDWPDPVARMKEYHIDVVAPWIHPGYPIFYRFAEGEKVRAAGLQLWAYNINYQTHYPLIESRLTMWEFFQQKADGWLYYSVNSWPKDSKPIDPSRGPLVDYVPETPNSQGELIYEGIDGPIGSLRFANVRDGVEDYEYLWALKEKAGDIEVAREMAESVAWGILQWTNNPVAVSTARDQVAQWIVRPYLARSPAPGHRSKNVRQKINLIWGVDHPGDVRAFEVYLGTDRESVRNASSKSSEHLGRTTDPEVAAGKLRAQTTYFWRVDEVTRRGVYPGYVWSFTTGAE